MKGDKTQYRIIYDTDYYYKIQEKVWWWPFWMSVGFRYSTVEEAEIDIKLLKKPKVKRKAKVIKYL